MSDDKLNMIYDLLKQDRTEAADSRKEVRDAHQKTDEKLTRIETETSDRLAKIEALDEVQNQQLQEHMRRSDLLEELHKDNSKRITVLEEPGKFRKYLKENIIMIAKIAGAVVTIGSAVAWLMGLF